MIAPAPAVRKVEPRCYQCGGTHELVRGDGPIICRLCIRVGVRIADMVRDHDDTVREGWR